MQSHIVSFGMRQTRQNWIRGGRCWRLAGTAGLAGLAGLTGLTGLAGQAEGWMVAVCVPKHFILEAWRLHFGTLLVYLDDPGVPGDTPQATWGSRPGFLSILGGFWDPLGTHFEVVLVTCL